MTFNFKVGPERIRLNAHTCKVCGYIWAEDKEHLAALRKHLSLVSKYVK